MFLTKIDNSDTHGNLIISHTRIIMECVLNPLYLKKVGKKSINTVLGGGFFVFGDGGWGVCFWTVRST